MSEPTYSVVVVSWNVAERLRACLAALERERSAGADLEVIVVDNASADGSAKLVRREFPNVRLLALPENRGFAAACNLGAREAQGQFLVLLNHDVEVAPGFSRALSEFWATHPRAGVVGGRVVGPGGRLQPSVRRFPTLWSSLLDALKLLRRFPHLAGRYLACDFDYTRAQVVDQVMGACFAVRRELWRTLEGFDERFFVWFEEVDFCKRVRERGSEVWYTPSFSVNHVGAASFKQLRPLRRHQLFTQALKQYVSKHLGTVSTALVAIASLAGYVPAFVADVVARLKQAGYATQFSSALVGFILLDILSWYGWRSPWLGSLGALALGLAWLFVARRSVGLAALLLVTELILGSQGYLLSVEVGETVLSLRLVLFLAAFSYLVWYTVTRRNVRLPRAGLTYWYAGALTALVWGTAVGILRGNEFANMALDLNGYLYVLLWPLFMMAATDNKLTHWLKLLVPAALAWLALKTLVALYLFSHVPTDVLLPFYQWWRQTGFGEITYVSGNIFRIFSQSQMFGAVAAASCLALLSRGIGQRRGLWPLTIVSLVILLASLSRSFWLGAVVALAATIIVYAASRPSWRSFLRYVGVTSLLIVASGGLILAVTRLSWPLQPLAEGEAAIFAQRLQGEAASASRLRLLTPLWDQISGHLIVGAGFGAIVTYRSLDPRIVRSTAGGSGLTTTYAFEWGYLDSLLKLGLLGFTAFMTFWLIGAYRVLRSNKWLAAGLLALLVLNMTTPYLNHPLGLGALMGILAWAEPLARESPTTL